MKIETTLHRRVSSGNVHAQACRHYLNELLKSRYQLRMQGIILERRTRNAFFHGQFQIHIGTI